MTALAVNASVFVFEGVSFLGLPESSAIFAFTTGDKMR